MLKIIFWCFRRENSKSPDASNLKSNIYLAHIFLTKNFGVGYTELLNLKKTKDNNNISNMAILFLTTFFQICREEERGAITAKTEKIFFS